MMTEAAVRRVLPWLWICVLPLAMACSESTTGPDGPSAEFDAQAAAEAVRRASPGMDQNDDMLSGLELVGSSMQGGAAFSHVVSLFRAGGSLPALSREARATLGSGTRAPAAADPSHASPPSDVTGGRVAASLLIPESVLGTTFTWDTESGSYRADPDRTGAPEEGVRFILYVVDQASGTPAVPLEEVGYVDLVDESTVESGLRLRVRVVDTRDGGETTRADYVVEGSFTVAGSTRASISAEGFISDGTRRLDFELHQSLVIPAGSAVAQGTLDYTLSVPGEDLELSLVVTGDFDLESGEPRGSTSILTLTDGADRIVVEITSTDGSLHGTMAHNGETVILIQGSPGDPEFTKPDGSPLTAAERAALGDLVDAVERLLEFADSILGVFSRD